jgi:methionyl-tRNA formyltransferase
MSRVVIFSPSRFSLYTTTVAEMLRRRDVDICSIVVMRLFNYRRFTSEIARDGTRLLRKIWKKLVLREKGYRADDVETIVGYRREHTINYRNVDAFCRRWDVPVVYCDTLNDLGVIDQLDRDKPDLVVFTGGGLIRGDVLDRSGNGVVNCHMGVLPKYRGMDVVEWPILEGETDQVGVTVHFMDRGVDTGDILTIRYIEPRRDESIARLRTRFEPIMCEAMVETCIDFLGGKLTRRPQRIEDGKQYFVMHSELIRLVRGKLPTQAVDGVKR